MRTTFTALAVTVGIFQASFAHAGYLSKLKTKWNQFTTGNSALVKAAFSPENPIQGLETKIFLNVETNYSSPNKVNTFLTAELDEAINVDLLHPAEKLWIAKILPFNELGSHHLKVRTYIEDLDESKNIRDAITDLNQQIILLQTQIDNETDPDHRAELQATMQQKIGQKAQYEVALVALRRLIGEDDLQFTVSPNTASPNFPQIVSVNPSAASQDSNAQITVSGLNFTSTAKVYLSGTELATLFLNSTTLKATLSSLVGPGLKNVEVRIPTVGGNYKNAILTNGFFVVAGSAPTALAYSANPAIYTKGIQIVPNVPVNSGGMVSQYSITPALPAGLSMSTSTGVISGTPSVLSPLTQYAVTATNSFGSTNVTLNLAVNDKAPVNLSYSENPAVYTKGIAISDNIPSSSGGVITQYSIYPSLPAGLNLNTSNGKISGTPLVTSALQTYTVTGITSGGSTSANIQIRVKEAAPASLTYETLAGIYTVNGTILTNHPISTGGAITSYSIDSALPQGLSFSTSTGVISGTPTTTSPLSTYVVTGANESGSISVQISIVVKNKAILAITGNSFSDIPNGDSSEPNVITITNTGESDAFISAYAITNGTSYSITGSTCQIAQALTQNQSCTITIVFHPTTVGIKEESLNVIYANGAGFAQSNKTFVAKSLDTTLASISYSQNPVIYTKGIAITPNVATVIGGTPVSFTAVPSLPNGLNLNSHTGEITGTPQVLVTTPTNFIIIASNNSSKTAVNLNITINDQPPQGFTYDVMNAVYTRDTLITNNNPHFTGGGPALSYTVQPALPVGLSLSVMTGVISGTPTSVTENTEYVVTATNSGGSAQVHIHIRVKDKLPQFVYSQPTAVYEKGTSITNNVPVHSGGAVVSYSIDKTLPAGLNFNTATGVISGTPTEVKAQDVYTVTGTNETGSYNTQVTITVNDKPPVIVSYQNESATYTKGFAIVSNSPSTSGGDITSWTIAPSLPAGFNFNPQTGIISGYPLVDSAQASYTITASNSGGTSNKTIQVQVNLPSGFSAVATGDKNTAVIFNGALYAMGDNEFGQLMLGTGKYSPSYAPVATELTSGVTAVAVSRHHMCAVQNGALKCAGLNNKGQLGNNTQTSNAGAQSVFEPLNSGVLSVTVGPEYTCAVKTDFSMYCFGNLGGVVNKVPVLIASSDVKMMSGGRWHSCGTFSDGQKCAGGNLFGQLGNGSTSSSATYEFAQNMLSGVNIVSASPVNSCGIQNGALKCAGYNLHGELGNNTNSNSLVPVQVFGKTEKVSFVSSGGCTTNGHGGAPGEIRCAYDGGDDGDHTCSIVDGALSCFGDNKFGALGDGTNTDSNVPVQVSGLTSNVKTVASSARHTCAIVGSDLKCWGDNMWGQLGVGNFVSTNAPAKVVIPAGAPTNLQYATPNVYQKNVAITPNVPTNSGGIISNYAITPALPAGLSLNVASGVISGTPTATKVLTTYTITGKNIGGQTTKQITIVVNEQAPTNLVYPTNPAVYVKGTTIATNTPTHGGGVANSYVISPALPTGLTMSATTGAVSGNPSVVSPSTNYTVTLSNASGSTQAILNITVNDIAPNINYAGSPYTFTVGNTISAITPANSGGAITGCSATALPAGLSISSTCVISGTPTAISGLTSYTITATNSGGSNSKTIQIKVNDVAPSSLVYNPGTAVYIKNYAIAPNAPSNSGGAITSYSISPSLPTGLSMNTSTGIISGTPSVTLATTAFTVTGSNSGGSAQATFNLTVTDAAVLVISNTAIPDTVVGTTSNPIVFTVQNIGQSAASAINISRIGSAYTLVGDTCGNSVPPTQTCTITVTFHPTAVGAFQLTLNANYNNGGGSDIATRTVSGNGIAPAAPTGIALTTPASSPGNLASPVFTVSSNAAPSGMTANIYTDSSCSVPSLKGSASVASGATATNVTVSPSLTSDGSNTYYANFSDGNGNYSACVGSAVYNYDSTAPSAPTGLVMNPVGPANNANPFVLGSAEANSSVKIYATNNCSGSVVATGSAAAFVSPGISVSAALNSTTFYSSTATDAAGNVSTCSVAVSYTEDSAAPVVTISSTSADPTVLALIPVTFTVSETVTDFTVADISVTNGTLSGFAGSGTSYSVNVTPSANSTGVITVGVAAGAVHDSSGNPNPAATDLTRTYFSKIPQITLVTNSPSNNATPTLSVNNIISGVNANIYTNNTCAGAPKGTVASTSITQNVNSSTLSPDGTFTFYSDVTDSSGAHSQCSVLSGTNASVSYVLDTAPAIVTSVASSTASGFYNATDAIDVSVTFSKYVVVTGSPQIALNSGGTANYVSGSGSSTLVFLYVVQSGENSARLDYSSTSSLSGTIKDVAGNNANKTLPATGTNGLYTINAVVDTILPTAVTSLAMSPASGSISNDYTPVITGDGEGAATVKIYTDSNCTTQVGEGAISGSGDSNPNPNAAFEVSNISFANDGSQDGLKSFYYTITDIAGNGTSCASTALSYTLKTTAPAAPTSIVLTTPAASPGNNPTPVFTVNGSAAPAGLTANIFTDSSCTIPALKGSSSVTTGATATPVTVSPALSVDGSLTYYANFADNAGNKSTCTGSAEYTYDGSSPTVLTVTTTTASGSYSTGTAVNVTVGFSENVTVTGSPKITLNTTPAQTANYVSGSGTNSLVFTYTVQAGDNSSRLDYASTTSLALNGGTIKDAATNAATLTLPATGASGLYNKNIVIDTVAPTVSTVTTTTSSGTYGAGNSINVTIGFSENVIVTGTPNITLNTSPTQTANYVSGSGTNALVFMYTVQSGDSSSRLDYASISSLTLNGGSIADVATNNAGLTLPTVGSSGLYATNIVISSGPPKHLVWIPTNASLTHDRQNTVSVGGQCQSFMIQIQDALGTPAAAPSNVSIAISGFGSGNFYTNNICTTTLSGNATTIATSQNTATIYFKDNISENLTLTATAAGYVSGNKSVATVTVTQLGQTSKTSSGLAATVANGDIYVAGETDGNLVSCNGVSGNCSGSATGVKDYFVSLYSSSGTHQWTVQKGVISKTTEVHGIAADSATGDVYVVGSTNANLVAGAGISTGTLDYYIAKYNQNGVLIWIKQRGISAKESIATGVAVDSSGNVYISGRTTGNLQTGSGSSQGLVDYFVAKYNSGGTLIVTRQLGQTGKTSIGYGVSFGSGGEFYVSGQTNANLPSCTGGISTNCSGNSVGTQDIFISKYSNVGTFIYTRQLGQSSKTTNTGYGLITDATGIYLAGVTNGNIVSCNGVSANCSGNSSGTQDYFVLKYNLAGAFQWAQQLGQGGGTVTVGNGVTLDLSGNIYVAGQTTGNLVSCNGSSANCQVAFETTNDYFVSKYNSNGVFAWTKQHGVPAGKATAASSIATVANGDIFVTGTTTGNLVTGTGNSQGVSDVFTTKFLAQ